METGVRLYHLQSNTYRYKPVKAYQFKRYGVLAFLIIMVFSKATAQNSQTFNSSTTWTPPAGVTCIKVEARGGGGAGGGATRTSGTVNGGGGAGGAYAAGCFNVSQIGYTVTVGGQKTATATSTAIENKGNPSWFDNVSALYAEGGNGGAPGNNSTGAGGLGSAAASIGNMSTIAGGNGANGNTGSPGSTGGAGGNGGGAGAAGVTNNNNGNTGTAPGGGGSGGRRSSSGNSSGGTGAAGRVVIYWFNPSNFNTAVAAQVCEGASATVNVTSTTLASGNYTVTYDLSGANTASGNTATMAFSGSSGSFSTAVLPNAGNTTVTITSITITGWNCSAVISTGNTATITVNTRPTVAATPSSQNACSGSPITTISITNPNNIAGTTFTWSRTTPAGISGIATSGSGSTISGTFTNSTNASITTTFTITATAGTCSSTTTVTVTVNPLPTVNAVANQSYCDNGAGAAINFGSNVSGVTYNWTSTADVGFGTSGVGNIPAFTPINAPVTATVSVTASIGGCSGPVRNFTITVNSQPSVTISADYCIVPGKVRLTADPLPAGSYTYSWSNGATTQVIDVDIAGSYTVTVTNTNGCQATNSITIATELAVNGNFEAGNVGFLSGYEYNATANGLQPEGRYAVNTNPQFTHTNFWGKDHTTGTGKMMIVNGLVGPTVWQQTVAVVPNTTYYFSAWALSMNNLAPFAQLQFSVNGNIIGTSAVLVAGVNNNSTNTNWQRFYGIWSSGPLSSATCSIVDLQGALGGNDFALDDISISTLSPAAFTVTPSVIGGGTAVCLGNTLNLAANLTGGSSPYTFSWTGPNGFTSDLENPSIPNTTAANAGTYTLTATDFYGCVTVGSRVISVNPPPAAPTPVTATPATICLGSSVNLNGTTPAGTQSDFTGFFNVANWTYTNNPSATTGGSVNTAGSPISVSITSGNNGTAGNTDYTITNGPTAGNFSFNWSYVSTEVAANDIPQYSINGGAAVTMPGFNTAGAASQSGTASIAVPANQTFTIRMRTTTGTGGSATMTISNFSGPLSGNITWYTVPSGGSSIGSSVSAANFSATPPSSGTYSYYAEALSPIGCVGSDRTQVIVNINTAPSFSLCPSNVVTTITAGSCSKVVSYSATATGSASPSYSYTFTGATSGSGSGTGSGSAFNKGVTTVTITANTGCAPNATCVFTITVNDTQAPTYTLCPSNQVKNTAPGVCTYTASGAEFNSTASDNCSIVSNTAVLTGATTGSGFSTLAGKVFNKGVTTVTWTASDGSNTVTCTFTVTVNDNQAPAYSACPSNLTRNTSPGSCTYTVSGAEFNSTATDNCSVLSNTASLSGATSGSGFATLAGQVFNKGVTTVTWTAADGSSNTASCTFTVTVNDNQAPTFSGCPSNSTRSTDPGTCTYTSTGSEFNVTASDNCSVLTKTASLTGATTAAGLATLAGQVFNKGVTTITWSANDGVNNGICAFTVTVTDNELPTITCPADISTCSNTPSLLNPSFTDNCPGATISNNAPANFPAGTTIVTWTVTDASGNIATCTQNVTVNPVPTISGSISGPLNVCETTSGFIYSIPATALATTYNWTVPAGWTITSGNGTTSITVTSGNSGQNGNISVTAGNACGNGLPVTAPVAIMTKGTWLGASTNWHDPSNWCGGVPDQLTDVTIPVTMSGLYPVVSSAVAQVHDIHINAGASVIINGQSIQVSGLVDCSGNNFDISNGTLELNGNTGAQDISGNMFTTKTIRNLRISNTNGVNLVGVNDTLKLSGVLTFGVSNAVLQTNGNLTLLSNAFGTASVGDMTNAGANSGNDIIGNVTVERYIPNHFKAWQFLAVPTKGQTVNAAWQEGNSPLSNSNNPGYGTIITSNIPGAVALGFDVYTPSGPTMKVYDPLSNGWNGIANPSQPIANQKGYMLFVRGDRSVTAFNQPATATILRTTGQLYTKDANAPAPVNVSAGNFESVANPFASAIDFNKVDKSGGIQDLFYVWDPKLTISPYSAYGLGAYQTVIGPGPDYIIVPGGGSYTADNTNIESGQAFFVHAPFADGTVSFPESCKVNGSFTVTRPSNNTVKQMKNNLHVIQNGSPVLLDGTLVQFNDSYSNALDEMDALKMTNSSENLSIMRNNNKLVAERRDEVHSTDTIYYNIGLMRVQQYQFEFIPSNLDHDGLAAFLEDNYMNTSTPVSMGDTTRISFSIVNIPGSYAPDRFRLVFQKLAPTPVHITYIAAVRNPDKTITVNWKVENESNIQSYMVERSEDGSNFNGILTAPPIANNGGRADYTQVDISPLAQDNFYRIKAISDIGKVEYSSIVKVGQLKRMPEISIWPNPVTGHKAQLYFSDQPAGRYTVSLVYSNGVQQKITDIEVMASISVHSITLPQYLASGIYRLKITGPDNRPVMKTIHIASE